MINKFKENLDRLNIKINVQKVDFLKAKFTEKYDSILLDAPCSALGTFKRNPDVTLKIDQSKIKMHQKKQIQMIEKSLKIPTDAHVFFSLKEDNTNLKGLGRHNDTQHNLIVCVDGSFDIKVYGDEILEKTMNNGDAIFVPRKIDHEIIPLTKRLSVSFPMAPHHTFFQTREWVKL